MLTLYLSLVENETEKKLVSKIYELYLKKMINAAANVTHDDKLAEEAVHESFLIIIKTPEKLLSMAEEKWAAWLAAVTINKAKDILRKENKQGVPVNEDFWVQQPTNDNMEERLILHDGIKKLPEMYREILELYYLFGYDVAEIAEMQNISTDNARQRLSRARKILRKSLMENS